MISIVTKSYCPYCRSAKAFLESLGKEYQEIEISSDPENYEKYKAISGMQTVPQIFDGEPSRETLIGGNDDMMAKYYAGKIFTW